MGFDWPEAASEFELLLGRDRLIAEKDHQVVVERCSNCQKRLFAHSLSKIDTHDFRAERA